MTRNMVYKARRKVLARLRQLCGDYDADGQLCQQVRLAIEAMPDASTERSLTLQVERTMR
jgi:hypothetical protein